MTATDELRALLDARGVEWTAHDNAWVNETYWKDANGKQVWASERVAPIGNIAPGGLVQKRHTTPAQAVEATLGRGTCHMTLRDDMRGHAYQDVYECSECGEQVVRETYMGESEQPKFCPSCGREVVE